MEENETLNECLNREILEETGIEINDNTLLVLRGQNQKLNEGIIQAQKGNLESWGICDGLWTPKGSKTYFGLGSEKPIKGVLTGNNWKIP